MASILGQTNVVQNNSNNNNSSARSYNGWQQQFDASYLQPNAEQQQQGQPQPQSQNQQPQQQPQPPPPPQQQQQQQQQQQSTSQQQQQPDQSEANFNSLFQQSNCSLFSTRNWLHTNNAEVPTNSFQNQASDQTFPSSVTNTTSATDYSAMANYLDCLKTAVRKFYLF